MKYAILTAPNTKDLSSQVNFGIADGWKPIGGVSAWDGKFYQAMILPPSKETKETKIQKKPRI